MHSVLLSMHLVFLNGNGLLLVILAFHFFFLSELCILSFNTGVSCGSILLHIIHFYGLF